MKADMLAKMMGEYHEENCCFAFLVFTAFRQQNGSWGVAINLGDKINTGASEAGATVTPDGKYLFFQRFISPGNLDIFWVDAQIIETLRPKP